MKNIWVALVALALVSCNGESGDTEDSGDDSTPDIVDEVDDPVEEPELDLVEEEPEPVCTYPEGPYGFDTIGATAGPMAWPSMVKGPEELYELDYADFEVFFCDPEVQSIIVVIATTWCPYCPGRVRNLIGLDFHYIEYGAKFVWVLGDGEEAGVEAYDYFSEYGADFGWFTDDSDNSMGPGTIADTELLEGVPWVFVIDAETMEVVHNNPSSVYSITMDLYND